MVPAAGLTQVNAGHHKMRHDNHDINPIDSEEGGNDHGIMERRFPDGGLLRYRK